MGNSCRARRREKRLFKKGCDWWKFSIWNRVMGSNQSGYSSGKSCRKILQENLVGKSCRIILWENLVGNCCGKILQEYLAGQG